MGVLHWRGPTARPRQALKAKGNPSAIKAGTKVRDIRLVDGTGGHDIDRGIDGFGAMRLKSDAMGVGKNIGAEPVLDEGRGRIETAGDVRGSCEGGARGAGVPSGWRRLLWRPGRLGHVADSHFAQPDGGCARPRDLERA